jgi:regulator of sigma E protease
VVTAGSVAEQVGIQSGDRIVSVADRAVPTWEDFHIAVGTRANRETSIRFQRGSEELTRTVTPQSTARGRFDIGEIGVLPDVHPRIRAVVKGEPAERAGLLANDQVLAVNGEPVTFGSNLREAIAKRPEQEIVLSILRDGTPIDVRATPARRGVDGRLGIEIADETVSVKPGVLGAALMSVEKNIEYSGLIFQTVWGLLTRETSPRQLMGPVAIAQLSGESAQLGWIALFALMAQISPNLGLLNLLPIPILDGGHILIMALEGLARRDFSTRLKEKMLLAGFVVLMTLMVTVIYNDLTRISWLERLMPWR